MEAFLAFTFGKFAAYLLFFLIVGRAMAHGSAARALLAAFHRFWLGLAATALDLAAILLLAWILGTSVERGIANQIFVTGLVWGFRALAWHLSLVWAHPSLRDRIGARTVIVLLGLALNLGIDLLLWGGWIRVGGGPFAPSLGSWDVRL